MIKDSNTHLNLANLFEETASIFSLYKLKWKDIKWAIVTSPKGRFLLKPDYTKEEASMFAKFLNQEYYKGFGESYIGGKIVFKNNSWIERREYDGAEWWEYFKTPEFKEEDYQDLISLEQEFAIYKSPSCIYGRFMKEEIKK